MRIIQADANRIPLRFSTDGKAVEYVVNTETGSRIVRQGFDDKAGKTFYESEKDTIFNYAWSKSGNWIVMSRGPQLRDAVMLSDFGK